MEEMTYLLIIEDKSSQLTINLIPLVKPEMTLRRDLPFRAVTLIN